jgi:hypothetical protein
VRWVAPLAGRGASSRAGDWPAVVAGCPRGAWLLSRRPGCRLRTPLLRSADAQGGRLESLTLLPLEGCGGPLGSYGPVGQGQPVGAEHPGPGSSTGVGREGGAAALLLTSWQPALAATGAAQGLQAGPTPTRPAAPRHLLGCVAAGEAAPGYTRKVRAGMKGCACDGDRSAERPMPFSANAEPEPLPALLLAPQGGVVGGYTRPGSAQVRSCLLPPLPGAEGRGPLFASSDDASHTPLLWSAQPSCDGHGALGGSSSGGGDGDVGEVGGQEWRRWLVQALEPQPDRPSCLAASQSSGGKGAILASVSPSQLTVYKWVSC